MIPLYTQIRRWLGFVLIFFFTEVLNLLKGSNLSRNSNEYIDVTILFTHFNVNKFIIKVNIPYIFAICHPRNTIILNFKSVVFSGFTTTFGRRNIRSIHLLVRQKALANCVTIWSKASLNAINPGKITVRLIK
jgi:hypothetical protein